MAHAVGNWRSVPGAAAGADYARCMPFRYNGLRSETSAEVKQDVLTAMRHAYRTAKAANAPEEAYWSYMPKNLTVWNQCRTSEGATDAEEEALLDVAGSDATDEEEHPVEEQAPPPGVPAEAVQPVWWASKRRGATTKRHYAAAFQPLDGRLPTATSRTAFVLQTVCKKKMPRSVNGQEDATVLALQPCPRCQSTGWRGPEPVPPWTFE